jgi:hypothetical protein
MARLRIAALNLLWLVCLQLIRTTRHNGAAGDVSATPTSELSLRFLIISGLGL